MAMGNFCQIKAIECPYATATGGCRDNIFDDFGLCEMEGDNMPPKNLSAEERRDWCRTKRARWIRNYTCSRCGETVGTIQKECPFCHATMDLDA